MSITSSRLDRVPVSTTTTQFVPQIALHSHYLPLNHSTQSPLSQSGTGSYLPLLPNPISPSSPGGWRTSSKVAMNVQQNLQCISCSRFRNLFPPGSKRCLDFSRRLFPRILQRSSGCQIHSPYDAVDSPAATSREKVQRADITFSVTRIIRVRPQILTLWRYSYATSVNPN